MTCNLNLWTKIDSKAFVDKKTTWPVLQHKVQVEVVTVDLFVPLPSSNYVAVAQDFGPRYAATKIVSSAKTKKVIPALNDIYSTDRNSEKQLTDKLLPFSSQNMNKFVNQNNIKHQKMAQLHPLSNKVESTVKNNENDPYEQRLRKIILRTTITKL